MEGLPAMWVQFAKSLPRQRRQNPLENPCGQHSLPLVMLEHVMSLRKALHLAGLAGSTLFIVSLAAFSRGGL
jgi:hypothetical protein